MGSFHNFSSQAAWQEMFFIPLGEKITAVGYVYHLGSDGSGTVAIDCVGADDEEIPKLWSYLQKHLAQHKVPVADQGYVSAAIDLPYRHNVLMFSVRGGRGNSLDRLVAGIHRGLAKISDMVELVGFDLALPAPPSRTLCAVL